MLDIVALVIGSGIVGGIFGMLIKLGKHDHEHQQLRDDMKKVQEEVEVLQAESTDGKIQHAQIQTELAGLKIGQSEIKESVASIQEAFVNFATTYRQ